MPTNIPQTAKTLAVILTYAMVAWAGYHEGGLNSKADLEKGRADWATEKAKLNAEAISSLEEALNRNKAMKEEQDRKLAEAQSSYSDKVKEINYAKANAIAAVNVSGLWVDIDPSTCNSGGGSALSGASKAVGGSGTTRCKLLDSTAKPLIEMMSEADTVATTLNLCIRESGSSQSK